MFFCNSHIVQERCLHFTLSGRACKAPSKGDKDRVGWAETCRKECERERENSYAEIMSGEGGDRVRAGTGSEKLTSPDRMSMTRLHIHLATWAWLFSQRGEYFLCVLVHGSKMLSGEVMFLAAVAWVEGRGRWRDK